MSTWNDIGSILSNVIGANTGGAGTDDRAYQSKVVLYGTLTDALRKYDLDHDKSGLASTKDQIKVTSDLIKARATILSAGVRGAGSEANANTAAATRLLGDQLKAYIDLTKRNYDKSYGDLLYRIMEDPQVSQNAGNPKDAANKAWELLLDRYQPGSGGAATLLKMAEETIGPAPVSGPSASSPKLAALRANAAEEERKTNAVATLIPTLTAGGSGTQSMQAAKEALALLEATDPATFSSDPEVAKAALDAKSKDVAAKEAEIQEGHDRIQDTLDKLSADIFGGAAQDQYGGMNESQWKEVIGAKNFRRFSQEHGFEVGSVSEDGKYNPGKQDYRAVAAFIRAEKGHRIAGTSNRPQDTYVALNVQGGAENVEAYKHPTGTYFVDEKGVYATPEQVEEAQSSDKKQPLRYERMSVTKMGADGQPAEGYVQNPDETIDYVDFVTGSRTPITDKGGIFLSFGKQSSQETERKFNEDTKDAPLVTVSAGKDGTPLTMQDLLVMKSQNADFGNLEVRPELDEERVSRFKETDIPPEGNHAVYGKVLAHKPSDPDDVVRISTVGGPKMFKETTNPQTGEKVYENVDKSKGEFSLPASATVLEGNIPTVSVKDLIQRHVGKQDERYGRELVQPPLPKAERISADKSLQTDEAKALEEPLPNYLTDTPVAPKRPPVSYVTDALQQMRAKNAFARADKADELSAKSAEAQVKLDEDKAKEAAFQAKFKQAAPPVTPALPEPTVAPVDTVAQKLEVMRQARAQRPAPVAPPVEAKASPVDPMGMGAKRAASQKAREEYDAVLQELIMLPPSKDKDAAIRQAKIDAMAKGMR